MSSLIIYFNGNYYEKMDFQMPSFKSLPFFERVTANEKYVAEKMKEFKIMFLDKFINIVNNYEIYLQI